MTTSKIDINRIRIASPCPTPWNQMSGDDRTRHCNRCDLHVHNISGMRADEVRELLNSANGPVCVRLFRRKDGTIITRDCPVGVRTRRQRISYFAAGVFSTLLALCSAAFGQAGQGQTTVDIGKNIEIRRVIDKNNSTTISGIVLDMNGAIIPGAKVLLTGKKSKVSRTMDVSIDDGFQFSSLPLDVFSLKITAPNFKAGRVKSLKIAQNEEVRLTVRLETTGEILGTVESFLSTPITASQIISLPPQTKSNLPLEKIYDIKP